jgi:integrase
LRIKNIGATAKETGVIKREVTFSPHLFRRSYATGLYKIGMGIKAIQEKTRHASIETLVKHYICDSEPATLYLDKMLA